MALHIWPCPRAPTWVTLNLYWTLNIPLQKIKFCFTTSMGHYSQMIGRKFTRIPRVKWSWGKAETSARKILTNHVWDEPWNHTVTPDRGHRTRIHTQTHAFSMQAQQIHTHYEKTQCGIQTHTQSTNTPSKVTANDTEESFNDRYIVYCYFCR